MKKVNLKYKQKKNKNLTLNLLNFVNNKKYWIENLFFEQTADSTVSKSLSVWSFDWWLCLNISASDASMQPPVGPFLGQHGFNTNLFCKTFNDLTQKFPKGMPLKVIIKLFNDKTFLFKVKLPSTSYLIYSIIKNSSKPYLSTLDILKLAFLKKIDLPNIKIISLTSMILGTVKSMKLSVKKN